MAALNAHQLAELRRRIQSDWTTAIDFNKVVANDTLQAIEDWYEGERAAVSLLIDAASGAKSFTSPEKKLIAKHYLAWKFEQGG